MCLAKKIG